MGCKQRRDVEIPDCKESNPADCHRSFYLYLPSIVCGDDGSNRLRGVQRTAGDTTPGSNDGQLPASTSSETVGTLPLVFGIHCFGCSADSINVFASHADNANVVLVLPEGLQHSFNARHCCGYALQNQIDDVGFLKHIQSMLSDEYSFVHSDFSYAAGWSNGGYLVMHAATLFRSISPISGFMYEIDPLVTKAGTFCVDGICVDAPGSGKGIFLHHGVDDTFVRSTGCCNDPDMPKCCCGIAADTCVSTMEVARNWAREVNGCQLEEEVGSGRILEEKDEDEGKGGGEEEEKEAKATKSESDEKESGSTGDEDDKGEDAKEEDVKIATGGKFSASYDDSDRGIQCFTTTGTDCKANSTICLHQHAGHFNTPSFEKAFPFAKEVIVFFVKDACEIHGGKWDESSDSCACPEDRSGTFCLDDLIVTEKVSPEVVNDFLIIDSGEASSKGTWKAVGGCFFLAFVFWYVIRNRCKRGKKKVDRFSTDVSDEEVTELVTPQRFQ